MFGRGDHNLLGVATLPPVSTGASVARCPHAEPRGTFDVNLEVYYQSDADFGEICGMAVEPVPGKRSSDAVP